MSVSDERLDSGFIVSVIVVLVLVFIGGMGLGAWLERRQSDEIPATVELTVRCA